MSSADLLAVPATITAVHRNGRFTAQLETGQLVQAYTAGRMRKWQIVTGDHVTVELSPYDTGLGRVVYIAR